MGNEGGTWIMHGRSWDDPRRIRSWQELTDRVNEVGFLPLFSNRIPGFSVEEQVSDAFWWTGDREQDPWEWREIIARSGEIAYGKFFGNRAGFISKAWLPLFANYRRSGYDFDARWEDGLAKYREKKIMDCFDSSAELESPRLKQLAGFGKDGEKNFDGILAELQMQTYLVVTDFRRKRNKYGCPYGMPVCVYTRPETLWGEALVTDAYHEPPEESRQRIFAHVRSLYPDAAEKSLICELK